MMLLEESTMHSKYRTRAYITRFCLETVFQDGDIFFKATRDISALVRILDLRVLIVIDCLNWSIHCID